MNSDGSKIIFYSNQDSGSRDIFVMNVNRENVVQLTENAEASFSPDGTKKLLLADKRAIVYFCTMDIMDFDQLFAEVEMGMPEDNLNMEIELIAPIRMEIAKCFH